MNSLVRRLMLGAVSLGLAGAASAQWWPYPPPPPPPPPAEWGWEAPLPPPGGGWGEPQPAPPTNGGWGQGPVQPAPQQTSARTSSPIEPLDLPPSVEQGVDMVYVDPELKAPTAQFDGRFGGAGDFDLLAPEHPVYAELRRGLTRYRMRWGGLPQVQIPAGAPIKPGDKGDRVMLLRERLGLEPLGSYDAALSAAVREFQETHGLKADGIAGPGTVAALNRGFEHYERLLMINLERAKRLPSPGQEGRYILVDAGSARLWMYEDGRPVDSMKVIVGEQKTATPMMAGMLRFVSLNPYWNVPPEFARDVTAKAVLREGVKYLTDREYEVLSDWTDSARIIDPATVDWKAVAEGKVEVRLRRKPSPANSMGAIKFMLPNDYGIYLHDTPDKSLFAKDDRWISNGCVRVEDWRRLAAFLFGRVPQPTSGQPEEKVDLPRPVPIYMTYLTAGVGPNGVAFRPDPYKRDEAVLARYFGGGPQVASTLRR